MRIYSNDFRSGEEIPKDLSCDGAGRMPSLEVADIPTNTKTVAAIIEDPDAPSGMYTHFLAWNIPINEGGGICKIDNLSTLGKNSSGKTDYVSPCPPSGRHRYYFRVYALDIELNLPVGSSRQELEQAMQGHVLKEAELLGTYSR